MLFNGAKPQSPLSSRNQTKQALRTQCCKMGHSPKPHILHELVERKNMEHINQQLQKIITLTPYHLGELIETIDRVETELHNDEVHKNMTQHQDIIKHLEQIKAQANIIRRARNTYGTNDLVAVMRLEIAQNQLQKLL